MSATRVIAITPLRQIVEASTVTSFVVATARAVVSTNRSISSMQLSSAREDVRMSKEHEGIFDLVKTL